MKKVHIVPHVICGNRTLDAQRFKNYFLKNGYEYVNNPETAELIVIVTCGISKGSSKKAIEKIDRYKNYDAEIVITGCLPTAQPGALDDHFNGKIITVTDISRARPDISRRFIESWIKPEWKD